MDINLLSDTAKEREEAELRRLQAEAGKVPMSSPEIAERQPGLATKPVESHESLPSPPPKSWLRRLLGSRVHALKNPPVPEHHVTVIASQHPLPQVSEPPPKATRGSVDHPIPLKQPVQPLPPVSPHPASSSPKPDIAVRPAQPLTARFPASSPLPAVQPTVAKPPAVVPPVAGPPPARRRIVPIVLAGACVVIVVGSIALRAALQTVAERRVAAAAVAERALAAELATYATSEADAALLHARVARLAEILKNHMSLAPLTTILQDTVVPTVQYTKLVVADETHLAASGLAVSFEDVAKQQAALAAASSVTAVRLASAEYDPNQRLVHFTLTVELRSRTLRYATQ